MILIEPQLRDILKQFLLEDLGSGDITANCFASSGERTGWLVARQGCVVAGLPFARQIFALVDDIVWEQEVDDGDLIEAGQVLASVRGKGHSLLQGERVALNILQRLSGIASQTRRLVDLVRQYDVRLTDTRKTTPGLRWFEKYAIRKGGGFNHRWGLYDAVMIKDNHIKLAGSIAAAIAAVKKNVGHAVKIEVEVESLSQVDAALAAGADIIMLDNMTASSVACAVELIDGRAVTEASGDVGPANIEHYAATGVDYISIGRLTHTVKAMNIGFDLDQPKGVR